MAVRAIESLVSWLEQALDIDGMLRTWLLVEPAVRAAQAPALVFLHGLDDPAMSDQARGHYRIFAEHARALDFIAAFPRGSLGALPSQPGSLGWEPAGEDANRTFLHRLAEVLVRDLDADPARLVLAGFSNGAFFVAKELARGAETPFAAFLLSAGGAPTGGRVGPRRSRVHVEVGHQDTHQRDAVRELVEQLRSAGWLDGRDLRAVEHPGGHVLEVRDFEDVWRFLTSR